MGEISIWDDAQGFVAETNFSPDAIRYGHQTATRRRGGLRAVADKAARSRYGMTLSALDLKASGDRPSSAVVRAAHEAVCIVSGLRVHVDRAGREIP